MVVQSISFQAQDDYNNNTCCWIAAQASENERRQDHRSRGTTRQKVVPREIPFRQKVVPHEIEFDNNPHASSIKALPPSSSPRQALEGHGDSSDHHLAQSHLELKGTNTQEKRLSGSSNSSRDVNFKRRRIEPDLGSVYLNPNDEFLLNCNFLSEVPGSSQQTPNHVEVCSLF